MIVPLTLGDFLERAELVYGDREAVVDEPNPPGGGLGRFTYAQFAEMSRSLGSALDDLGVGENERVGIVSPNAARFLIALFGVSVFGRILVPINFRLNAEEIRYIVEHSGSSVLLVDPELDDALKGELKQVVSDFKATWQDRAFNPQPDPPADPTKAIAAEAGTSNK